ncbi:pathogenesis-related protein 1B-like [Arachis ipaensis]|nr:pathogenesis-related protein 1B-like [Arachis ipaensis]XP_025637118.1 pathogenesis-related protein 1B-like [Arachis hypogaea]
MGRLPILAVVTSFVNILPLCLLAQNSPQDYLKVHNAARAIVGVEPLLWDSELESYANKLLSRHTVDCLRVEQIQYTLYGRNFASYDSSFENFSGADAVASWVEQRQNYDYKSNSCIDGTPTCLTYIQVVSKASTHLGCARVKCINGDTLVGCYYHPAPIAGQRPY